MWVVVTGVALTGLICHPQDLWWIDKELKHKHKRLKMNLRRLAATSFRFRCGGKSGDGRGVTRSRVIGEWQDWWFFFCISVTRLIKQMTEVQRQDEGPLNDNY